MCSRLILDGKMYICHNCFDELKEYRKTWPYKMAASKVEDKIKEFMESEVGKYKILESHDEIEEDEIEEEFKRLTE